MSAHLDDLHQQYHAMLRDGLEPTGLVLEYAMLKAITNAAGRDDPRIQWSDSGPERLFGFRPQFVLSAPPRFTYPPSLAATGPVRRDFTLRELRAL
ncbi:MAG: hypothetical protein JWQ97_1155 [Phenylobacterium sp.]|nr:hypothetical protein [Phenylobacterium sp.]